MFTLSAMRKINTHGGLAAAQRVIEALQAALAAEGLHGEPLTPGGHG